VQLDQWYLDVKGKKYGPYTLVQIQNLFRKRQIIEDDKITAPHMQGKWISLREFVIEHPLPAVVEEAEIAPQKIPQHSNDHSHEPKSIPPRPDEKSLTGLLSPKYAAKAAAAAAHSDADPLVELFDVYQAAHERKPTKPSSQISMPEVVGIRDNGRSSGIWFRLAAIICFGAAFAWGVKTFLNNKQEFSPAARIENSRNSASETPATHTEQSTPPPATAMAPTHPVPGLPATASANHPRISLTRPPVNDTAQEREKEREREREADREREIERERDMAGDTAPSKEGAKEGGKDAGRESERDSESERERERERERNGETNEGGNNMAPPPGSPGAPGTPGSLPADYRPTGN
jgi:hypothetical protein